MFFCEVDGSRGRGKEMLEYVRILLTATRSRPEMKPWNCNQIGNHWICLVDVLLGLGHFFVWISMEL
jgi:hypothetical protein